MEERKIYHIQYKIQFFDLPLLKKSVKRSVMFS